MSSANAKVCMSSFIKKVSPIEAAFLGTMDPDYSGTGEPNQPYRPATARRDSHSVSTLKS